ncbi:trypsin-like serine peptidase [Reichenbachiella ulvae]|uniref:Serine protease n=1 Tax=Reichenbachiella ulvae TaxID=2980104 RepID=A0ABT3CQK0_9BACT|nr:trypsin-like peptidase domain-containing protein [Reichenbachiella ulvae]MCV9385990.1 trypsin-like peptidase domain-containing protein [Reichenbachiella ulvae]
MKINDIKKSNQKKTKIMNDKNQQLVSNTLLDLKPLNSSFQIQSDTDSVSIVPEQIEKVELASENPIPVSGYKEQNENYSEELDEINKSFNFSKYPNDQIAEVIIGTDDRKRINQTTSWPYLTHGHMVIKFPNNKVYIGSGTIVNKHHVITAGHCVFSKRDGGWAKSVMFYPAQNDNYLPFGGIPVVKLWSVKGWTEKSDTNWDFGMLILNEEIYKKTGHLGIIAYRDHRKLLRHRVNVTGYPGDKGGRQMWTHADIIKSTSNQRVIYDIDTMGGQSGSGVWSKFDNYKPYHVCAIHTTGDYSGNGATRISMALFDSIVKIMSSSF